MTEIESLRSAVWGWDIAAFVGGFLGVVGLIIQFGIEAGRTKGAWESKIKRFSKVLLIAGVVIPTVAQYKTSEISGLVVAVLEDRVKSHELEIQKLQSQNFFLWLRAVAAEAKNLEHEERLKKSETRQKTTEIRQEKTEKKVAAVDIRTGPRPLDEDDLWLHTRKLRRIFPIVTLVRVAELEPNAYAEKIGRSLKRSNINVTAEPYKELTLLAGVFICEGAGARRLSKAMERGGVPNRVVFAKDKEWPDACTVRTSGAFGPSFVTRSGTVIFVGHNPAVVR